MTIVQPPAFAARLLRRLVPAQDHDALLGDLCEEYQHRRSLAWYWLQILGAIVVRSWKDVRTHPLVAARATAFGLIVQLLLIAAFPRLLNVLTGGGFMWRGSWVGLRWYWHWPYAPSLDAVMMAIWLTGHFVIGWLIVRLHREHGLTTVLVCCGVFGALNAAGLRQLAHVTGRPADLGALLYVAAKGQIFTGALMIAGGYTATRPLEAV